METLIGIQNDNLDQNIIKVSLTLPAQDQNIKCKPKHASTD